MQDTGLAGGCGRTLDDLAESAAGVALAFGGMALLLAAAALAEWLRP